MKQLKQREKMLIKTTSQRQTEELSIEKIKSPFHSYQQHHDLNDRHTPDCRIRSYNELSTQDQHRFSVLTAFWFSQKLLFKSFRNQTYTEHNHTHVTVTHVTVTHTLILCTNIQADAMNSNMTCLLCGSLTNTDLYLKKANDDEKGELLTQRDKHEEEEAAHWRRAAHSSAAEWEC